MASAVLAVAVQAAAERGARRPVAVAGAAGAAVAAARPVGRGQGVPVQQTGGALALKGLPWSGVAWPGRQNPARGAAAQRPLMARCQMCHSTAALSA
ncbi:hypothetical protein [uncultured Pseudosulfitobacter sp.]|uniref:hypothetical protein n=1 Tax=uncultured Pseudosulfitobacter sp. TaxID=2854214 RepID=UPI0030DB20C7